VDGCSLDRASVLADAARKLARGDAGAAEAAYRAQLAVAPDDAEILSNLGAALNAAGRNAEAEQACRAALGVRPGYWAALANLAVALHGQHRQTEAAGVYVAALNAHAGNAQAWTNAGVCWRELGDLRAALVAGRAALKLAPDDPDLRCNLAITLLTAGELAEGFAEFEWRWRCARMRPHGYGAPQWRGEAARGRTILVHAEGGFGDTLQFVRYARLLARDGALPVVLAQRPLRRLLTRGLGGAARVIAEGDAVPPHDLQCPMLSLPHGFGTTLSTVPAEVPYLTADPALAARAKARLGHLPGVKVGLVWSGSPLFGQPELRAMNERRSMRLSDLATLFEIAGVSLVSLQYERDPARETAALSGRLFDPMGDVADFDDTAALLCAVDLLISVDTAVAHLAGALGRPVWVLSRHDACWRWLGDRSDSPWYPTLRHYRQAKPGDWGGVVAQVAADLRALVAGGGAN
jgi:tetratricopeptide (TPR) repeat protein